MCAMSSLAEFPDYIRRLFVKQEVNPQGFYRIRFFKDGVWTTVTVDDYIPCDENNMPIFCKPKGNQIWMLLLEKAYAKLFGSYFSLTGGDTSQALIDLSGCPTKYIDLISDMNI